MSSENKAGFLDYFLMLLKWRRLIITNFFIVSFFAVAVVLILPKRYSATAVILPPSSDTGGLGLTSLLGGLSGIGGFGGMAGSTEEVARFMAIMESRTLMEKIVNKFGLMERYNCENMEETVKTLNDHMSSEIAENGSIKISAVASTKAFAFTEDKENEARNTATNMANYIVAQLDSLNKLFKVESARNHRLFIEKRYKQNLADLKKVEEEYKAFQEKYKAVALPEQTTAAIQVMANLKAEMTTKEVEVNYLEKSLGGTHSELLRAKRELEAMQKRYNEFISKENTTGKEADSDNTSSDIFLPINQVPDITMQYVRLFRELEIQQKILEVLLPEYEQAKIKEAKDTPTLQILDKAVKPILRDSPKRGIICIFSAFMSVLFSAIYVFFAEYKQRLQKEDYEKYQKIEAVTSELASLPRNLLGPKKNKRQNLLK